MGMQESKEKKFIYTEREDLFDPNIYIHFYVKVTGNPKTDDLVKAVKAAFCANESTMSKIVLEEDGSACYERMEESGCRVFVTEKDWKTIVIENEKQAFRIYEGEMMRVFVISSGQETGLFIMAHHLTGDGKSIAYFLEDTMRALAGKKLVFKPMNLVTDDLFPRNSELPFFYKLYAKRFNRRWNKNACNFNWEDYEKIHKTYWKNRSSNIVYRSFTVEEVNIIRKKAKTVGVSVNSFITTAFLGANPGNGCIGMAVDIRKDHNRAMSNQASGISVDYHYSPRLSFEENARIVHKKVHKKLDRPVMRWFILRFLPLFEPTLLDSVLFAAYDLCQNRTSLKLAEVMEYKGEKTRELGVTNLGRLDIPDTYGDYGVKELLFIPPVVSYAKHIVGVATMKDGMRISYHFMNDSDKEEEEKFFERAMEYLRI